MRSVMNTRGWFSLKEQEMLAPQLVANAEVANTMAHMEREHFLQQEEEGSNEDQIAGAWVAPK